MKKTILVAVITTLLTNLIISSWLLLALALVIGWIWVGLKFKALALAFPNPPSDVDYYVHCGFIGVIPFLYTYKMDGLKAISSAVINFWK